MADKTLTDKERIFILEYLNNGFNGTQAAIKAGYSKNCAAEIASENLRKPHIRQYIKDYLDPIINSYKDTLEFEILKTYKILAFYDPADIIDTNGKLIKDKIEDYGELSIVIKGIEKKINYQGKATIKVILEDRNEALDKLCQYMGLLKQRVEVSGKINITEKSPSEEKEILLETVELLFDDDDEMLQKAVTKVNNKFKEQDAITN